MKNNNPEDNIFKDCPWSSFEEYHALVKKHGLAGSELKIYLKKLQSKKRFIPYPDIRPSKSKPTI